MNWIIRIYRPGDEFAVSKLAADSFDDAFRPYYDEDGTALFAHYILPESVAARQRDGYQIFLAERGGQIAGVLEMRGFEHVSMLFVDRAFRRGGAARALLERALFLAKKVKPSLAAVTVYAVPGAVDAYRKLGFEAEGGERAECGIRYIPMAKGL